MKPILIQYLCCPICKFVFDVVMLEETESEITEGLLCCNGPERHVFPIIRSIPRSQSTLKILMIKVLFWSFVIPSAHV